MIDVWVRHKSESPVVFLDLDVWVRHKSESPVVFDMGRHVLDEYEITWRCKQLREVRVRVRVRVRISNQ